MKRTLTVLVAVLMLFALASCNEQEGSNSYVLESKEPVSQVVPGEQENIDMNTDKVYCRIFVKDMGCITLELYNSKAPITVANFVEQAVAGFYDGLIFHRVISSFMVQGGSADGTGYSYGTEKTIKGEFSANGVDTGLKHTRGTISMARTGNGYDTASTQFFIVHQTSQNNTLSLDGKYAAFGQVIEGIEVVDKIAAVKTGANNRPVNDVVIEALRIYQNDPR